MNNFYFQLLILHIDKITIFLRVPVCRPTTTPNVVKHNNIQNSFGICLPENKNAESDVFDNGIFMLQTIEVERLRFKLFFDNGWGDMVTK